MQNQFLKIAVLMLVIGGSCFVVWKAHDGLQSAASKLDVDSFVDIKDESDHRASDPAPEATPPKKKIEPTLARTKPVPELEPVSAQPLPESAFALLASAPPSSTIPASSPPAQTESNQAPSALPDFFAEDSKPAMSAAEAAPQTAALELPAQNSEAPLESQPDERLSMAQQPAPRASAAAMDDPFSSFPPPNSAPQVEQERDLPKLPEPEPLPAMQVEDPLASAETPIPERTPNRFGPTAQPLETPDPISQPAPGLTRLPASVASPVLLPTMAAQPEVAPAQPEAVPSEITRAGGTASEFPEVQPAGGTSPAATPRPFLAVGVENSMPERTQTAEPQLMPVPAREEPAAPRSIEDWALGAKPTPAPTSEPVLPTPAGKATAADWSLEKNVPSTAPSEPTNPFGMQISSARRSDSQQQETPPLPPTGPEIRPANAMPANDGLPEILPYQAKEKPRTSPIVSAALDQERDNGRASQALATQPAEEPQPVTLASGVQPIGSTPRVVPAAMPVENDLPQLNNSPQFQTQVETNPLFGAASSGTESPTGPNAPELKIEKIAPPEAVIGQPIVYAIMIRNVGGSTAQDVVVEDRIPRGTQLEGTIPQGYLNEGKLTWQLGNMAPGDEKKIQLKVTPTESGKIGSVATVSFASSISSNMKVTAPQLAISMKGPAEAALGEQVTYQFRLQNLGQGTAKSVFLRAILPPGLKHPGGNDIEYEAGNLDSGAEKIIELTVTPEKPGSFVPVAQISSESKTHGETRSELNVIRTRLELSRTGPETRYVQRPAPCVIRITNHSTKPLSNLTVQEKLPAEVELANVPRGGRWDAKSRVVTWTIPQLAPGETQELNTSYIANAAGTLRGSLIATDDSGDRVEVPTLLKVKGFSDLTADVTTAQRTVLVGERVTFRLTLRNEGSAPAKDVRAKFIFPAGFDLISAHGPAEFTTAEQTVQFNPVPEVDIAKEQVYEIALNAHIQGTSKVTVVLESSDYSEPLVRDHPIRVISNNP